MSYILLLAALVSGGWYTVALCVFALSLLLYSHIRSNRKSNNDLVKNDEINNEKFGGIDKGV